MFGAVVVAAAVIGLGVPKFASEEGLATDCLEWSGLAAAVVVLDRLFLLASEQAVVLSEPAFVAE